MKWGSKAETCFGFHRDIETENRLRRRRIRFILRLFLLIIYQIISSKALL